MNRFWVWLRQEGPKGWKHANDWKHPIVVALLQYIIVWNVCIFYNDRLVVLPTMPEYNNTHIAVWLGFYVIWMFGWRFWLFYSDKVERQGVLYEYSWMCNSTLIMTSLSIMTHRPLVSLAHAMAVSIDQILWYVDLLGYLLFRYVQTQSLFVLYEIYYNKIIASCTQYSLFFFFSLDKKLYLYILFIFGNNDCRKFPIGVAKYLTWPNTNWMTRLTCTHHLWTIPLILYNTIVTTEGFVYAFGLSMIIVCINVILSRFWSPSLIHPTKYLNVNLSHSLWKDITFSWLQIETDHPTTTIYIFRLLWRWYLFNLLITTFILYPIYLLLS